MTYTKLTGKTTVMTIIHILSKTIFKEIVFISKTQLEQI